MRRFRARSIRDQLIKYEADTTDEIHDYLRTKDLEGEHYQVECMVDDIIISDTEFMKAFADGEMPGDLSFF